jgi:Tfp pilus assembly protein PilN
MAASVLKLNLAPPSNAWRSNHQALGWAALALGALVLAGSLGLTVQAYRSAGKSGRQAGALDAQIQATTDAKARILADLRNIDVAAELPHWRLAERIFTERSLPWSRLTAELERSLVEDVRLTSIQRNRSADMKVQIKLKGEARTREAEAAFVESLAKNAFFEQVILEREGELQGGGVKFDYTLAVASVPPAYVPLPKYGPPAKARPAHAAAAPMPFRPGAAVPLRPGAAAPVPPGRSEFPAQEGPPGRYVPGLPHHQQPVRHLPEHEEAEE